MSLVDDSILAEVLSAKTEASVDPSVRDLGRLASGSDVDEQVWVRSLGPFGGTVAKVCGDSRLDLFGQQNGSTTDLQSAVMDIGQQQLACCGPR
ncbi:hypothetical protein [Nocardia terpenica]|uniref:Uncharacterized protein n=1 Tax=Nocardia terpenica TaxID=455432 RepID=A0A6G9Z9U5_9NOCA|nr:hypothetical protein [Nocardia terpenica]QIS22171.1 hypothetical protein F6W96_31335 [Nocardia terpenica]